MPFTPEKALPSLSLLNSRPGSFPLRSKMQGNEEIRKVAAESLLELDPQNPAGHILLCSIYAAKGKWSDVARLRRGMREKGVRKGPGFRWIKYKSKVHIFSADDQ